MTILEINKFYHPQGGADVVMLEESRLLSDHGHTVVPFAMKNQKNLPSPYAHAFVSAIPTARVGYGLAELKTAGRFFYSFEARKKLSGLITRTKPDIAHVHNIYHQLSPSVLDALGSARVPAVMTVHDWALLAPNYMLFDHGAICERGRLGAWQTIHHRCIKDSYLASTLAASAFAFHRLTRAYERGIRQFIAPSVFVKNKLVAAGFSEHRITVIPHFIDASKIVMGSVGNYVAYMGRLSPEKGILTLIKAAALHPDIPVKIAGTGPEEEKLKAFVSDHHLLNVEFVGRLDGVARDRFYQQALCVVVPSIWYELFGLVVLEAYAAGKPVIASAIGALPELVREGETGALVSPEDPVALASAIANLAQNLDQAKTQGIAGRVWIETNFTPDAHYTALMSVYQSAISASI